MHCALLTYWMSWLVVVYKEYSKRLYFLFCNIDNPEFSVFDGANYCGGVVIHDR